MRLTLTLLAAALAAPAWAADGHEWLDKRVHWTSFGEAPGRAYSAPGGPRQADNRRDHRKLDRFGQFLAGAVNSNDGLDLRSGAFSPTEDGRRLGVDGLRGVIRDGTDEDALTMEVYKGWQVQESGRIIGDPIASKTWDYEGKSANGDRQRFNFRKLDAGAVAVRFVTGDGPRGLGNGFSWRVNDVTYICPPDEPHQAAAKKTAKAAGKGRSESRSESRKGSKSSKGGGKRK